VSGLSHNLVLQVLIKLSLPQLFSSKGGRKQHQHVIVPPGNIFTEQIRALHPSIPGLSTTALHRLRNTEQESTRALQLLKLSNAKILLPLPFLQLPRACNHKYRHHSILHWSSDLFSFSLSKPTRFSSTVQHCQVQKRRQKSPWLRYITFNASKSPLPFSPQLLQPSSFLAPNSTCADVKAHRPLVQWSICDPSRPRGDTLRLRGAAW